MLFKFDMNFLSSFKHLLNLPGKIYREQPGRLTKEISFEGQEAFVKLHFGVGYLEIFKNLFQGRLPILGARTEYLALKKLAELNIPSLEVLAFDVSGANPAHQRSYLVTKALKDVTSLEDLCANWQKNPPSIRFKRALIRAIAKIAATMHASGMNHRDFYLCHFLFDEKYYAATQEIKLYLIDLHRAQIRKRVPWRWQVKDIAGLYFSALKLPLTRRDLFCFMEAYSKSLAPRFWREVERKAWVLYEKTYCQKIRGFFVSVCFDPEFSSSLEFFLKDPDAAMQKGRLLKHDATTTVAVSEDSRLIFKRYNARDFAKGFKRLFKASRARRCWMQAFRFRHLGIATPEPVAMMERLRFGFLRESYFVSEFLTGEDLRMLLKKHPEKMSVVDAQMENIFLALKDIRTAHGDFKATNLWWHEGEIYLLDLDGVRQYEDEVTLLRALAKDRQRFLRNWES